MTARVIVPNRGQEAAKTRLASILSPPERGDLAAHLLRRVLRIAVQAVPDVVVISPSAALAELVEPMGARLAVQHGMGLNEGLDQARASATADGVDLLIVLHGDLPELGVPDVLALVDAVPAPAGVAVAPDRRGTGTNGLGLRPLDAIGFHFGAGSRAAHEAAAIAAGVPVRIVERPGLAFDLDTPEDLRGWLESGVLA